jgi:hypothetical protein
MQKKVDISSYLQSARGHDAGDETEQSSARALPKHDPTYSSLLGYGWRKPKLLPPDPHPDKTER